MIYAIDFDGTIVTHEYPEIGKPVPYALDIMKHLIDRGDKIILWTMRSGETLYQAADYIRKNGVELWSLNSNPQQNWSKSPKAYAQHYIDDAALGCPLIQDTSYGGYRPYVDWNNLFKLMNSDGLNWLQFKKKWMVDE